MKILNELYKYRFKKQIQTYNTVEKEKKLRMKRCSLNGLNPIQSVIYFWNRWRIHIDADMRNKLIRDDVHDRLT